MNRKKTLYAIAVLCNAILMLGGAGSIELNALTYEEGLWQIVLSMISGLWWWNLLRIEENRSCRKGRMN